jgi:uncharacterized membrane protein
VQGIYNDLATFGFSFLILISLWLRYTNIMSVFPLESRRVIILNIAMLFCVSIEPFLFNMVRNTPSGVSDPSAFADTVSMLYALDLGALFAILGMFTLTLASEDRKLIPKELLRAYRLSGASTVICALLFVFSALPFFFTITIGNDVPIRYYLWAIPLVLIWISRTAQKHLAGSGA